MNFCIDLFPKEMGSNVLSVLRQTYRLICNTKYLIFLLQKNWDAFAKTLNFKHFFQTYFYPELKLYQIQSREKRGGEGKGGRKGGGRSKEWVWKVREGEGVGKVGQRMGNERDWGSEGRGEMGKEGGMEGG